MNKRIRLKYFDILLYLVIFTGFISFIELMKYNLMFLDQILFLVIGLKFLNFLIFNELHLNIFHMHNLDIKEK